MLDQRDALLNLLKGGLGQIKVLVVGELVLDRYLLGDSDEKPIPTLRQVKRFERPAGAANVAMNLAGLGCQTFLCGFWGADREQEELAALLEAAGVDVTGVVSSVRPTVAQTRIWGGARELLRLAIAGPAAVPAEESVRLEARVVELVKKVHSVVLAGSTEEVLSDDLCATILRSARAASIPVLVQASTAALSRYSGATLVLIGLKQLAAATRLEVEYATAILDEVRNQMEEHEIQYLAIGMGAEGLTVLGPDGTATTHAGADPSLAADVIPALLAAGLTAGLEIGAATELAMLGAAIAVGKLGTAPVARQELIAALGSTQVGGPSEVSG
jgi:D-beta-D-heptose 7-phosphate kinase/D-beta-D-heptose 1-phosphate adenosyltransferase